MAKFDLAAAMGLQPVSKLDTEIREIELSLIDPNPENFFPVEKDITDLAESISLSGLCQPLVVMPADGGRYRVISGHRRRMALLRLASDYPDKYKMVNCVVRHPSSPEMEMLMLIQTNTEARDISWHTRQTAAEKVEAILVKLQKEQGVVLPGKMRANVAKIIKTSESQLARAKYITEHLCTEAKRQFKVASDNALYQFAHYDVKDQQAITAHYADRPWMLDKKALTNYSDNIKNGRDPFYRPEPKPIVRRCNKNQKVHCSNPIFASNNKNCKQHTCCAYCPCRMLCEDACQKLSEDIAKHKTSIEWIAGQYVKANREKLNIDKEEARKCLGTYDLGSFESGIIVANVTSFLRFAKKYNISLDKLVAMLPDMEGDANG